MKKNNWIFILTIILIFILSALCGYYYLDKSINKKNNYVINKLDDLQVQNKSANSSFEEQQDDQEQSADIKKDEQQEQEEQNTKITESKTKENINKINKKVSKDIKPVVIKKAEKKYSDLNENFDSWGDYISDEEGGYRRQIIYNLKIKTVIIDHLSKSNGISQEFFKIVYQTKMIPAKILEEIVISKEFRRLIPENYLIKETALNEINHGHYLTISNQDIKNLLILWSEGKLTPIQKAWEVGALK